MTDKPTLREAAEATVAAIESRQMIKIQEAGRELKETLARSPGRPPAVSDEEFSTLDHLTAIDASERLGITPDAVYRRRRRLKND